MRLIDADALFEALGLDQYNNAEGMTSEEEWIAEAIATAPTTDAEPVRRGRWVNNGNNTWSCSRCQSWLPDEQHYYARYCLFCGAKMEEGEE